MDFCTTSGGNTGIGECDLGALVIGTLIFAPRGEEINKNQDLMEFLEGKFSEVNKVNRYYPISGIDQATDNSEEAQMITLGYGRTVKSRDGDLIMQWDFLFELCKAKVIAQFDNWKSGLLLVSQDGVMVGKRNKDRNKISPFNPTQFNITNVQPFSTGGTDASLVSVQINFGNKIQFLKLMDIAQIEDFDKDEMVGLRDLELNILGQAAGYVDIQVIEKCSGTNIYDSYSTELNNVDLWSLVNKATGADATISGIALQAGTKAFRVSTTVTGVHILSLADTAVLAEAGIERMESEPIEVTLT